LLRRRTPPGAMRAELVTASHARERFGETALRSESFRQVARLGEARIAFRYPSMASSHRFFTASSRPASSRFHAFLGSSSTLFRKASSAASCAPRLCSVRARSNGCRSTHGSEQRSR
jgi:hypothetical protein